VIGEPNEPVVENEVEIAGNKYTALDRPQPLPHDWRWDDDRDMADYGVVLTDLGTGDLFVHNFWSPGDPSLTESRLAKWAGRETDYQISTPFALRAPEVILRAGYDTKIDIWAVGCLVRDSWP